MEEKRREKKETGGERIEKRGGLRKKRELSIRTREDDREDREDICERGEGKERGYIYNREERGGRREET